MNLSQIFALIAEGREALAAARDFAATYNKHKVTIGRIANILDPDRTNPLPAEEAKRKAIEIIDATPELRDALRERSDGN